jgi:hypothetical protein
VAALAALAAGPAGAWPGDPKPPRLSKDASSPLAATWINEHLDLDGWIVSAGAEHTYWFVSSIPSAAPDYPIVRDWVRGEHSDDVKTRSFLWRMEADCSKKRQRVLESYTYRDNNLRGPYVSTPSFGNDWLDTKQGSVMRGVVDSMCQGARR